MFGLSFFPHLIEAGHSAKTSCTHCTPPGGFTIMFTFIQLTSVHFHTPACLCLCFHCLRAGILTTVNFQVNIIDALCFLHPYLLQCGSGYCDSLVCLKTLQSPTENICHPAFKCPRYHLSLMFDACLLGRVFLLSTIRFHALFFLVFYRAEVCKLIVVYYLISPLSCNRCILFAFSQREM